MRLSTKVLHSNNFGREMFFSFSPVGWEIERDSDYNYSEYAIPYVRIMC